MVSTKPSMDIPADDAKFLYVDWLRETGWKSATACSRAAQP